MEVRFYRTLWGMGGTLDEQLARIKAAGFEGWEDWVKPHFEIKPLAEKHGLGYMAMVSGTDPEQFKHDLGEAFDCGCVGVTVHTGSSAWTYEQGAKFFEKALPITKQFPFPINFETHRGHLLYEPNSTAAYLKEFPDLHLVADLSHWTCVTTSMLGGYSEALELAISRVRHIHARYGLEEGPQVPDPRVPQWEGHVKAFEGFWDRIKDAHVKRGEKFITVDPEVGPPNYQWTDPKTGQPLADIWDVALWTRDRLRKRWA
ncbi:MAG: hypothetical protein BGO01_13000 [Armatimonadetes bacterium 55-13]|nr:sugar phosphate isomerase/epimerase [Armatimonadota bacterium]OJU61827.1 MAG: hypothetical protein BGO01_13000 [Armatimonadetes bacterium 55-13]